MENLNAEQIIKALECCANADCVNCPRWSEEWHSGMCNGFLSEVLSLIKELTEENERLRAEKETLEIYNADYKYKNKELTAFNRRWAKECAELQEECEYIKADTVRKMQERLRQCFDNTVDHMSIYTESQVLFAIDQIAKEMLEGEK